MSLPLSKPPVKDPNISLQWDQWFRRLYTAISGSGFVQRIGDTMTGLLKITSGGLTVSGGGISLSGGGNLVVSNGNITVSTGNITASSGDISVLGTHQFICGISGNISSNGSSQLTVNSNSDLLLTAPASSNVNTYLGSVLKQSILYNGTGGTNYYCIKYAGVAADNIYEEQLIRTSAGTGTYYFGGTDNMTFVWRSNSYVTKLQLENDGRLWGTGLHNNANAITGTTKHYIASGTYTPTVTLTTNCTASTARLARFTRVGNVVTVCGSVNITVTTANVTTVFELSLPVASSMAVASYCPGIVSTDVTSSVQAAGYITPNTSNQRFICTIKAAGSTGAIEHYYYAMYEVL